MRLALRQLIKDHKGDALFIPRSNPYQSEYVRPHEERLAYVTGFTGSAGQALITLDNAYLFVDGRYTLQAINETEGFEVLPHHTMKSYLKGRVLFDPNLVTVHHTNSFPDATWCPTPFNFIDHVWTTRPTVVDHSPYIYQPRREWLYTHPTLLTDVESVNWLLGLRGCDGGFTPTVYAYALILQECIHVFLEKPHTLPIQGVQFHTMDTLEGILSSYENVYVDPKTTPYALLPYLKNPLWKADPSVLERACKTREEQEGMRIAHQKDAKALSLFLQWIKTQDKTTEMDAAVYVENLRRQDPTYRGPSFPTISAANANGAIVHYHPTERTNTIIESPCLYLCDSGGQYLSGTTDVTRTIALGPASCEQKEMYTRVLKGHIALATVRFPHGTTGHQLDVLARQYLWEIGQDYAHGTGHGVGSFLCVHEGPQSISCHPNPTPLMPGMVVSNEPGFYKEGDFGIRIENLMLVREEQDGFLSFEMLTFVPLEEVLIVEDLLTSFEQKWIKGYQAQCRLKTVLDDFSHTP